MGKTFERAGFRQAYYAALCGAGAAITVFAIIPPLFAALFRLLCFLFGAAVRDNIFAGTVISILAFLFKFVGPIVLFLYLDGKQPTEPWCFWVNLCSQFLVLFLFRAPLMRLNSIPNGLFELRYLYLAIVWPVITVLTQWLASLYVRKKRATSGFSLRGKTGALIGGKRPLTTGAKIRRFLCVCLLLFGLAWLYMQRVYYPRAFYDYLEALPDPKACRVEVTCDSEIKWDLDETQRTELFERMERTTYRSAYGPRSLAESAPPDTMYVIYIYPTTGDALPPFSLQEGISFYSGFFCESPIFPVGYWLNMGNWYDLHNWLQDLPVD